MIEVLYDGYGPDAIRLLTNDPVRALGKTESRGRHLTCTALQDFHINVFTVYSPFSIKIKFDKKNNKVHTFGDDVLHKTTFNEDGSVEIQLYPQYVVRSKESVLVQLLPPLLTEFKYPAYVASGEFDISQWIRPVNTAFIVSAGIDEMEIKENDPLFSLRFVTKNNEPVKLIRKELTDGEKTLVNACSSVVNYKLGTKLSKLYKMFNVFKRSMNKCPFHR